MATPINVPADLPSAHTLNEVPTRAFVFIHALGTNTDIRKRMNAHGYTQEDHLEGWRLLEQVSNIRKAGSALAHVAATDALTELDQWDELGFHKAHAALVYRFPVQAQFVFEDLAPTQGPAAILGVITFLDRLDQLESGVGRDATKDADKQALELLAKRGIDGAERARLRALVTVAQSEPQTPAQVTTAKEIVDARTTSLGALYAWYSEWTEIAREVITKRADRISLGIAKRRTAESGSDDADPEAPTVPEAPVVPVVSAPEPIVTPVSPV
jgi:hypothetical protein